MFRKDNSAEGGSSASALFTVCSSFSSGQYFGTALLCLLVIQNTSAVLLARHTRLEYNYNVDHMLLISEIMKLVTSIVLEALTFVKVEDEETIPMTEGNNDGTRSKRFSMCNRGCALLQSFRTHIWDNPRDALKLTVPAGLYLLQNSLVYYSISLVPVPLFQITQQTKLVTTAFLSVLVLKRSYDRTQWYSILSLCVGAAICILSHASDKSSGENVDDPADADNINAASSLFGLLLIILSNLSSSVAGVYFEVVIKGKEGTASKILPSIWMRNIQLAIFTICIISAKLLSSDDETPFFYDFTPLLWIQISIFAFGGLLVASVIKYTDSVQKGLAAGLSVITSSALSMVIESSGGMSLNFILGSALAIGGCFFFANSNVDLGQIPCPSRVKRPSVKKVLGAMIVVIPLISMLNEYDMLKEVRVKFSYVEPKMTAVPDDWKDHVHVHVYEASGKENHNCGGCMVLWELADYVADLGISVSTSSVAKSTTEPILAGKTIALVYPEVSTDTVVIGSGNIVHVRWILAPLNKGKTYNYQAWGEDDLVFNYASSCAVHPKLLPNSNILQVITNPKEGDEFDLGAAVFSNTGRQGTAWTLRKGEHWHANIDYVHERLPEPHVQHDQPTAASLVNFEYFVSYDPYTFYSYEAAMAGAISIVHPLENVSKKEWALGTYVGEYLKETGGDVPGIAYGWSEEEIEYAKRTMPELRAFMLNVRKWGKEKTVERFAKDCYRYGTGEREFESGIMVKDAYTRWYDEGNNLLSLE
jgi:UDP-sugar transporter A1/2/3